MKEKITNLRMDTKAGQEKQHKIKKAALASAKAKFAAEQRDGALPATHTATPLRKVA